MTDEVDDEDASARLEPDLNPLFIDTRSVFYSSVVMPVNF